MVHALSHTALPLNTLLLGDIVDVSLARLDREPQTTPMVFSLTPELVGFEGDAISVSQSMLDGRQGDMLSWMCGWSELLCLLRVGHTG